ncbi:MULTISPECIES: hypothetical protein [Tsukamurella]|uniref:Uncharacterized protein n=2 Tax=Tsukamurella TaxID=2060 RepID=A0A5C5S6H8_9ACTN|nr:MULTISPECIES: hypothetical protein [Tsukamurella]NMD55166.1 hypothetical protein [Tsukamurella columbiensis]TWS30188.1 hypothetical protein FK530_06670 [Tsukamurella conjunctivitidis]
MELTIRTSEPSDHIAILDVLLWEVSWTTRNCIGRERRWNASHITERGARRTVANLLTERAPGLTVEAVFIDRT